MPVTLESSSQRSVTAVPTAALRDGRTLFVVRGGVVERRSVKAGVTADGYVEISSGLAPGEEVVLSPAPTLRDGERIVVHNEED